MLQKKGRREEGERLLFVLAGTVGVGHTCCPKREPKKQNNLKIKQKLTVTVKEKEKKRRRDRVDRIKIQ